MKEIVVTDEELMKLHKILSRGLCEGVKIRAAVYDVMEALELMWVRKEKNV